MHFAFVAAAFIALPTAPPPGVHRTPAEVIRDQIYEEGATQRKEAIDRERQRLDELARRTDVTLSSSTSPTSCDALREALHYGRRDVARGIASTAPKPGVLPATNTVGGVVDLWQRHCRLAPAESLTLIGAFGVVAPPASKPAPMPIPDLPAVAFPAGPPGDLPKSVTDARLVAPVAHVLGSLVPSDMARLDMSVRESDGGAPSRLQIVGAGPGSVGDARFLRELVYVDGELSRIEDTYYCANAKLQQNIPCQTATYAYRSGRVQTVSISRNGKITQAPIRILPSALPVFESGAAPIPNNHAPPQAIIAFDPPSDRIPAFSERPDPATLSAALTLPQRKFTETIEPVYLEGQITVLSLATLKLTDPKRRSTKGEPAVVFERFIDFTDDAPTYIQDSYYCELPEPRSEPRVVAPCGAVSYRYAGGFRKSTTPEPRHDWVAEGAAAVVRARPDALIPKGAAVVGPRPPDSHPA